MACEAEEKKRAKYATLAPSFCFVPVAVEILGALGEGTDQLFHELWRRITLITGEHCSTEFLFQRLSIAIQRGNAASVLGTMGLDSSQSHIILTLCSICNINYVD